MVYFFLFNICFQIIITFTFDFGMTPEFEKIHLLKLSKNVNLLILLLIQSHTFSLLCGLFLLCPQLKCISVGIYSSFLSLYNSRDRQIDIIKLRNLYIEECAYLSYSQFRFPQKHSSKGISRKQLIGLTFPRGRSEEPGCHRLKSVALQNSHVEI